MEWKVSLFKSGTKFDEVMTAIDRSDATRVALARNPGARVVSATPCFAPPPKPEFAPNGFGATDYDNEDRSYHSEMSTSQAMALVTICGGIFAFVYFTPFIFAAGAGAIGSGIGKLMPKRKLLIGTTLAIILGTVGYGYGEKLQTDWDLVDIGVEQVNA